VRVGIGAVAVAGVVVLMWWIWNQEAVLQWVRSARPLPFFALMAILPAIGMPMTPLFIVAGATFGARVGLGGSLLALAANLTLCYVAGRALRPVLRPLLDRFRYRLPDLETKTKKAATVTIAVKLAPGVPAFVKHYALAVAGVPFAVYFVLSMLITGAYGASLVVLGRSLFEHEVNHTVWIALALVVLAFGLWRWRRGRSSTLDKASPA
jgi:uncharacterized membrane protein YdjX (TVP38/TMEM64 family)